jgi:hypothetical protein
MFPTKFRLIWQSGFREDFLKSANQKQELPVAAMFVNRQFLFLIGWFLKKSSPLKLLSQINRNLVGSIYGRFSLKIAHFVPIWAIFIENLPMMPPTKFCFILESGFRGEIFFRNQPIRNKNGLCWPCLSTDRDGMSNLFISIQIFKNLLLWKCLAKWTETW